MEPAIPLLGAETLTAQLARVRHIWDTAVQHQRSHTWRRPRPETMKSGLVDKCAKVKADERRRQVEFSMSLSSS
jgi:hypothetical protein